MSFDFDVDMYTVLWLIEPVHAYICENYVKTFPHNPAGYGISTPEKGTKR
jgi:hypothetical protein